MPEPRLDDIALIAQRIERSVTEVRGRAASPDRGVTVEVDSTGRITDLSISETAVRAGADHLVSTLVHTQHAACADADTAGQELRAELLEDPRVARLMDRIDADPDKELVQPKLAQTEADDDQHFANFSVLRRA